jgi:predicted PurR-regulated permease PerM
MMVEEHSSPKWGTSAKIIVSLGILVILGLLVWQFQSFIGPIIFAFLLSYLLHPFCGFLSRKLHLSWRAATTILYLSIFLCIIGLLTWGGFSLVSPLQSLLTFIQGMLGDVPGFFNDLTSNPIVIGNLTIDLSRFNNSDLWAQVQSAISPALAKLGTLLGQIASGAASIVTMTIFMLIISYFITVESTGVRSQLITLQLPRFQDDINRFSRYTSRIWNSYFRGQLTIFVLTVIFYTILLSALGVNYAFALALLAGFARFVPYVGPTVTWITYGLVCIFQGSTIFGLMPLPYALIVIGCALVTDIIMDNFVSPRIMSEAVGIHPALVLVSVLVGAKLLGFVGVLIAAPAVATLKLLLIYVFRKLTDQDPWENVKITPAPIPMKLVFAGWIKKISSLGKKIAAFFVRLFTGNKANPVTDRKDKKE